jgi:hypothetical protein
VSVAQLRAEVERLTTLPLPPVAHKGAHATDAEMFLAAASRLERGYPLGGSNLRDAVVRLNAIADPFVRFMCGPCRRGLHDRCRRRTCECECGS